VTGFSRSERAALCRLLEQVGPSAPTLCAGWTTSDLAAHLVLRERSPAAVGIVVPPLAPLAKREMQRLQQRHGYAALVALLRSGPPQWSPYALPGVDAAANTVELFVHHEDVRRAAAARTPRPLPSEVEDTLWKRLTRMGWLVARKLPVGLELDRSDVAATKRIRSGDPSVAARGLPSELLLFCLGRQAVAEVELAGDPDAVEQLREAPLGL
jgi:uncharacterized protein (TIGR03085 family)